jgi:hypothetical protein
VYVGKTPYARLDLNDYSVPHTHLQRTVTVRATPDRVRILDGLAMIADHPRRRSHCPQAQSARASRRQPAHQRRAGQQGLLVRAGARGGNLGSITRGYRGRAGTGRFGFEIRVFPSGLASWRSNSVNASMISFAS